MESQGLPSAQNPVEAQSEQFDTPAPQEAAAIAPEETEVETTQETTVPMATENETPAAANPYAGKTQEELIGTGRNRGTADGFYRKRWCG